MDDLISTLDRFNRKERFFLVTTAVIGEPRFPLHDKFRAALSRATTLNVPDDAHAWMDYHLDWLYAALILQGDKKSGPFRSPRFPSGEKGKLPLNVNTNQEDVDLLIGFRRRSTTHLLLVEAKGVTQFGNAQLISKARRLRHIFGEDGKKYRGVHPWFVLASPTRPRLHSDRYRQG